MKTYISKYELLSFFLFLLISSLFVLFKHLPPTTDVKFMRNEINEIDEIKTIETSRKLQLR